MLAEHLPRPPAGAGDPDLFHASPHIAELLVEAGRPRTFARHQAVFREGDEGESVFLVTAGRFSMEIASTEGYSVTLEIFTRGEIFGDVGLFSTQPYRHATVSALEPSSVVMVRGEKFDAVRRDEPELAEFVTASLARRLREAASRILELSGVSARVRVFRVLRRLAAMYAVDGDPVVIPVSQHRLAGLAGTSRDTVNRALAGAERSGWVQTGRERIVIVDRDELSRLGEDAP